MALTEAEKLLIRGAKIIGADRDEATAILLALEKPEQQEELLSWMDEFMEEATLSDLIGKTMDIIAGRR